MMEARQGTGWRLDWPELSPAPRSAWRGQLSDDAIKPRDRYRLVIRSAWWEDDIEVEALAAIGTGYDTGEWDDPVNSSSSSSTLIGSAGSYKRATMSSSDRDRAPSAEHFLATGRQPDMSAVLPHVRSNGPPFGSGLQS